MSKPKRIISEKEIKNICKNYTNGISLRQLQKQTKLQQKTIKNIITSNNIKILSSYEKQKHKAMLEDRNYFDELNSQQCYVLGAIFGDGCVYYNEQKYKYALTLTNNDLDILQSTQELFGSSFPLKKRKKSKAYNLVINSKHLCQELISKFQLQSPKSNKLIFPNLPKENYVFFVSGLLGTDGCVRIDKRRQNKMCGLEFSYSSNCLEFVKSLREFLSNQLSIPNTDGCIKTNKTKRKNKNYSLQYFGNHANTILNWIYSKTTTKTYCKRKYDIYQNFLISLAFQTQ